MSSRKTVHAHDGDDDASRLFLCLQCTFFARVKGDDDWISSFRDYYQKSVRRNVTRFDDILF